MYLRCVPPHPPFSPHTDPLFSHLPTLPLLQVRPTVFNFVLPKLLKTPMMLNGIK